MAFGLFALLGIGTIKTVGGVKDFLDDTERRKNNCNPDGLTYVDHLGKTRLLSNNHLCRYCTADTTIDKYNGVKNGDRILIDIENHSLIKNFTIGKRKEEERKIKEKCVGHSTYYLDANDLHKKTMVGGVRFYDKKTGDEYVIRQSIDGQYFYVDVNTRLYVRKTDYQKKRDETDKFKDSRMSIDEVNNMVLKIRERNGLCEDYGSDPGVMAVYYM